MMSMKLDKRTRQIVDVVEKWMEDHNISVKNDERTNKILHDNDLSWQDLPYLYGKLGNDLQLRLKRVLNEI